MVSGNNVVQDKARAVTHGVAVSVNASAPNPGNVFVGGREVHGKTNKQHKRKNPALAGRFNGVTERRVKLCEVVGVRRFSQFVAHNLCVKVKLVGVLLYYSVSVVEGNSKRHSNNTNNTEEKSPS